MPRRRSTDDHVLASRERRIKKNTGTNGEKYTAPPTKIKNTDLPILNVPKNTLIALPRFAATPRKASPLYLNAFKK
jgi:hypothetical protein